MIGKLANDLPAATTDVVVYTVPTNSKGAKISINIVNTSANGLTIKVALAAGATPLDKEYVENGAVIPASGGSLEITDLICSPGENLVVNFSEANCPIRVAGEVYY